MNRWDKARHEQRVAAISRELGRLLRAQTEFASKGSTENSHCDWYCKRGHFSSKCAQGLRQDEASRKRIRELFAELERLRSAA